jgi:ABC-type lipoprotein release transport system permease subunit
MIARTLVLRSARYYWRTHLGVILGAALGAMVLTGALLVGDSVKATLREQALARVGRASVAMTGGDRFFRTELTSQRAVDGVPAILLRGSVARVDGNARVNQAQILGVEEGFWHMRPGEGNPPSKGELAINERLAAQLLVNEGDTLIVRVEKPGLFSRDAPLSGEENEIVSIRVKIGKVVTDAEFGRFGLQASQVPPFSVFLPLATLQEKIGMNGRANLLLASTPGYVFSGGPSVGFSIGSWRVPIPEWINQRAARKVMEDSKSYFPSEFKNGVAANFQLADASLEMRVVPTGEIELRSARVFLDPPVVNVAPPAQNDRRIEALTYFVNELRAGEKSTPYSMVTAVDTAASGFLPAELADGEIVISQWLAADLGVGVGGEVTIKYYVMGERRQLEEKERKFTVLAVIPMEEPQLNTSWMPDFPGLADKANCRDWKPGFDFDSTKMRDKDQAYWEKYRGTPKAFVNLKIGQEMWGNRWGNMTSIRWPAGTDMTALEKALLENITPEMLGFQFIPLREQALAATDAPVDFGELFVSFSFFLIIAAAVLTGMLFVFSLEQRNAEAGLLLALGLRPKQVRRLFLAEGAVLATLGGVLGALGGVLYTKLVLQALATVWRGAVGAVDFIFVLPPVTLVMGVVSGVVVALLAMWLASRRQLRHSARELLTGETDEPIKRGRGSVSAPLVVAVVCLVGAGVLLVFVKGAEAFFGAGALLLIAGLSLGLGGLRRLASVATNGLENIGQLGARNTTRRRGRSLATIAVLASGVFMVVAVDSFRKAPPRDGDTSDPGTGGFALVGESALPIYEDLNSAKGREAYGLSDETMHGVKVVPLRVRDGDDASCLNLNKALQPRLLGVKPEDFSARDNTRLFGLSWVTAIPHGWRGALEPHTALADDEVAGIVDANTLQWALKMKLGDTLKYKDERGQPFQVRIVGTVSGSILQGSIVVAESRFVQKFPGNGGYRYFLIDCPPEKTETVRAELSRALTDRGFELTTTARRLAEFQAVENTYLSIFQALGGLGLLLGSAGLAIVVARNVLERRREFGLLAAVGFQPRQLRHLVFAEHRWLIVAALLIGTASALVGVWPNLTEKTGGFPLREVGLLLAGLTLGCLFWTWLATRLALRGSGVAALRSE